MPTLHHPRTGLFTIGLSIVVLTAWTVVDTIPSAPIQAADRVCAGFFGCGPAPSWWVAAAVCLLAVPLLALVIGLADAGWDWWSA